MQAIVSTMRSVLLSGVLGLTVSVTSGAADQHEPGRYQRTGDHPYQPHQPHQPHHGQGMYGPADPAQVIVCLEHAGAEAPGKACYRPKDASLRVAPGRPGAALRGEVTMSLRLDQVEPLRRMLATAGDDAEQADVQVCIINGANICFEGPMEFVWMCITIGMLAGTECPPPPEPNMVAAIVSLAGPIRP